jgi:tetratricopeptide (TPR) repeat protein
VFRPKNIFRLSWILVLLSGIALSLKSLREPDLWWQLRTGQWMVDNFSVTKSDVFSFTQEGVEWINVKWFFEVLQYLFSGLGGPEMLLLMQTLANLLMLWLLYRLARSVFETHFEEKFSLSAAFILASLVFLFAMNYRMAGRPEMASHVLTASYLLLFAGHHRMKGKAIYWLIPLQALWTNIHEAYGTGLVIIGAMLAAHLLEVFWKKWKELDKTLVFASFGAIGATVLNPRGFYMFIHPFNIFGQVGSNKFTTELYDFQTSYYWDQLESWTALVILVIAVFGLFVLKRGKQSVLKQFGLGYFVLLLLFAYLGSTAHRNLTFFFIWSFPVLFLVFEKVGRWKMAKMLGNRTWFYPAAALLISAGCYAAIVSGYYYENFRERERVGLQVSPLFNPVGAANFLKDQNVGEQRIFSDYLVSSYLLWELRPEYKSFIDFRDLDIFPAEFFTAFNQLALYPEGFEAMDQEHNFSHAVLNRLFMPSLHAYLQASPKWQLVYGDAVAVVYEKKDERSLEIPFWSVPMVESSTLAKVLNTLFFPFRNEEKIPSGYLTAAEYYGSIGEIELAWSAAQKALEEDASSVDNRNMAMQVLVQKAMGAANVDERKAYFDIGMNILNQTGQREWLAADYMQYGRLFMATGDPVNAMGQLRKSSKLEENKDIFVLMAQCQNLLMQVDPQNQTLFAKKWYEYMLKAYEYAPEDPVLNFNLGVSYCQSSRCEDAIPYLQKVSFEASFSKGEMETLAQCKKLCGVN